MVVLAAAAAVGVERGVFQTLNSTAAAGLQPGGAYLVPSSQLVGPWGELTPLRGRPVDLAFHPQKRFLAIMNSRGVLITDPATGSTLSNIPSRATSYGGIAFHPEGWELWASEVTRNGPDSILVATIRTDGTPGAVRRIELDGHPVPVGIAFSGDGETAYVAFSRKNSVGVFDVRSRTLKFEAPAGMAPHGIAVSPKNGLIYVANRAGRRPAPKDVVAPSSGSKVLSDPKTGATASGTVLALNLKAEEFQSAKVGLAPSNVALSPDESTLAVVNGHSDSVSLLDARTLRGVEVKVPAMPEGTFGSQPVAAVFAPDGQSLFVACGGNNAIAVLRGSGLRFRLAGWLPTGYFPSAIGLAQDGGLRVVTIKGTGNTADGRGHFRSTAFEGSLERIPAAAYERLDAGTREVAAANSPRFTPAGGVANLSSLGIRHVFFIIKENRTYDQVFGDLPKGNGDPKLLMYGIDVTPNHHALASQWVLLDNFYATSAISFDGHHWLMQAFVSDYVERAFAASPRGYAWDMSDALTIAPSGFFWQGARRMLDVRIYGEFCLPAVWDPSTQSAVDINERSLHPWGAYWDLYRTGKWQTEVGCSAAGIPALRNIMSSRYPVNETAIPDQIRAEEFLRELAERQQSGKMPNLSIITLTADHTNGTAPDSPVPKAMVADNDLALGRMVEGISKSRFWPNSLILVVEDDSQDGLDHVDGKRTVALAIGPRVRRGAVDSNYYTQLSMLRTIQDVFQIPARTRALRASRAMSSIFTNQPDLTPYRSLPANIKLDEMNPPAKTLNGQRRWAAEASARMNWHDLDDVPSDVLNQILWWDAKGYNTPYPGPALARSRGAQK